MNTPEGQAAHKRLLEDERELVDLANSFIFLTEEHMARAKHLSPEKLLAYRQVTDAHLLALSLRRRGRLATFDEGIRGLVPDGLDAEKVVCVIPAAPAPRGS